MQTLIFILICAISIAAQTPSTVASLNEAEKNARSNDFETAVKALKATLRKAELENADSKFISRVQYDIGACEFRLDRPETAIAHLKDAIRSAKGYYPKAFYALGMASAKMKNWPDARKAFLTALKSNQSDGEIWFDLAIAYLGENDLTKAECAFRNSIRFGTRDASVSHNNIGVIRAFAGEMKDAVEYFETALTLSNGKLIEAERNLRFCRSFAAARPALVAKLEFSSRNLGETNE